MVVWAIEHRRRRLVRGEVVRRFHPVFYQIQPYFGLAISAVRGDSVIPFLIL
jgi:hypothetical protein